MYTLTSDEVDAALAGLDGWQRTDDAITKTFVFTAFTDAIAFVNRVAEQAEAADHHPDLFCSYTRVDVTLSTHSAAGITHKDVELAHAIERVA